MAKGLRKLATYGAALWLLALLGAAPSLAQKKTLTVEDLIGLLQNKAMDSTGAKSLTAEELEGHQRNRLHVEPRLEGGRDLRIEERDRVAEEAQRQSMPTADLEVYFDFDSAEITTRAVPILTTLGRALTDGRLAGGTFVVAGHTDAKGTADYNLALSQRRASAVRDYLIEKFTIDPAKLVAMGHGMKRLKAPGEPFAAINRRVQVINWTGVAAR